MIWASINKEVRAVWVENLWYQHTLRVTGPGLLPTKVRMKILHWLVIKAKNNVLRLYSDLRLLKASEFTRVSPDPTNAINLQSLLTCLEPSSNNEDETPSTKFARLLPRFWQGNERYDWANNKLVCQIFHALEILLSCSRARIGSFFYCKIKFDFSNAHGQKEHCKDEGMGEWTWAVCSTAYC